MAASGKEAADDEHGAQAADESSAAAGEQPVPAGDARGGQDQPQSVRDLEEPVVWPSYEDIVGVLYELAAGLFGSADNPFPAFQVSNRGLLESAIALPHQPYYVDFAEKLAAMVRSIAANHALRDGNKRLSVAVLHTTLLVNGYLYLWSDEDAAVVAERCAKGDTDFRWLADFIRVWTVRMSTHVPFDPPRLRVAIEAQRVAWSVGGTDAAGVLVAGHARGEIPAATIEQWVIDWREARGLD